MTYVALGTPRFSILPTVEGKAPVIPSARNILIVLFLSLWLGGWTFGGIGAMAALVETGEPFLAFWLCGWASGWLMASFILSRMLTGRQRLRVIGGDLEVETVMLGYSRRALYRARDIRGLSVQAPVWQARQTPPMPLLGASRGTVRFTYGRRTFSTGFGKDEAEGAAIVEWLQKKLPEAST